MAGSHQLFEQRTWPVFQISELVVEDVHHREQHIEPYHVGKRQRTDRMIATELHSLVDVLSVCIPLGEHEERFIDHRQQNAIDDEVRRAFDGDGRLAELLRKRHSCVMGRIAGQIGRGTGAAHGEDSISLHLARASLAILGRGHACSAARADMDRTAGPRAGASDARSDRRRGREQGSRTKQSGLKLVYERTYPPATADFAPIVRAIAAANPDLVVVNRSATKAFSFGLIEIAIYRFANDRLIVQPRILAETEVIERRMTIITMDGATDPIVVEDVAEESKALGRRESTSNKEHLRSWWEPILRMKFDDPEQEPPFWTTTNNVILNTPFPGIQIKAFAMVNSSRIGVFVSGPRRENVLMLQKYLKRHRASLKEQLPSGAEIRPGDCKISMGTDDCKSDEQKRTWIMKTLNEFVNVLRPHLRKWYAEA